MANAKITGNLEVTGNINGGGAVVKDLLWTNSNPSNSFEAQTISFNKSASGYTHLLFEIYIDKTESAGAKMRYYVLMDRESQRNHLIFYSYSWSSYQPAARGRKVSAHTDTTLTFGTGLLASSLISKFATDNDQAIPYKIYGIKLA